MNTDKWTKTGILKERQLAALNRDIATGIEQLDSGHYRIYNESNVMQMASDVARVGRRRLKTFSI